MSEKRPTKPVRGHEIRTGHILMIAETRKPVIQVGDGEDRMIRLHHGVHSYTDVRPDALMRILDLGSRVETREALPAESEGGHVWFAATPRRSRRRTA